MKISVIIATYNDPELKKCLESLKLSKKADFEVIVVDDGSDKIDVPKIVAEYPEFHCLKLEENTGPSISRNRGAEMATGEIVFFLDSDAQVYPDTLRKIQKRFEKDRSLQGLSIIWSDEPTHNTFFNKFKAIEMNHNFKRFFKATWGSNGSALYKDIFLKEGGFDEKFRKVYGEDFFLGMQLFRKGYKIDLDKSIIMKHKFYNGLMTGLIKYAKRGFLRAKELAKTKNRIETSYNSKKFKIVYLLSISILGFLFLGLFFPQLFLAAAAFYLVFFILNQKLYRKFYKKYGVIFFLLGTAFHYFYTLAIAISGISGIILGAISDKTQKIKKLFRWARLYFSQTPFYAIFYITSRCNARCKHCFNWKLIEESKTHQELTLEEIEKIAKNWGNMLMINLGGGEPYIRNDIPEIVEIFRRHTGVEIVGIPSNGLLTEKAIKVANELLGHFPDIHFRFTFSIDAIGEKHDEIRGVPGTFKKVVHTAKEIKKLKSKYDNFTLIINSCFMQDNQNNLLDTLKYLKKEVNPDIMGATYIRGEARSDKTQQNLHNQKYKEVVDYLTKLEYEGFKNHPLSKFIWGATNLTRHKVFENIKTGKRNFNCYVIKKMIVFDDQGNVKTCEILPGTLGNLRDNDYKIKKILRSDLAKSEYKKIKNKKCNCTWECAIRTGVMFNIKEYFSILKTVLLNKNETRH